MERRVTVSATCPQVSATVDTDTRTPPLWGCRVRNLSVAMSLTGVIAGPQGYRRASELSNPWGRGTWGGR